METVKISARIPKTYDNKLNHMVDKGFNKSAVIRNALAEYLKDK